MNLTDYHAKYFAHELTKRCPSDSAEKLAGALVDAQVDLNPHQVEAALFAFRSPLSKGALLADAELYLLRNHNSDKAISFFMESGFRPDFILWLLWEQQQTIAFIDPKGLRNFTDNFNNPKVQLFRRIKDLQTTLKREDIRLESFLIAQTHRNELRWPSPSAPDQRASASEYRGHHILCAKDDPDTYVRDLFTVLHSG
jgi:hypothetical protein